MYIADVSVRQSAETTPRPIDDPFAAGLRGFGPLGLLAIAAILLAGNVFPGRFVLPLGGLAALPYAIWAMFAAAGFGKETVFRGFAFERLRKLLGSSTWAKTFTVILTAAAFGAAHYSNQGIPGVQQAAIVGLVLGSIFAATGRIWLLIIAHAVLDLTALAMIYWNLESAVAHLVFK